MHPIIGKTVKILISRRFAVLLLIFTIVLFVIAVSLPYGDETEKITNPYYRAVIGIFGLNGITASPYFLILPVTIFASIFLCTMDRFRKKVHKDLDFWGSIIFHLGLLTIIVAGMTSTLTLFTGDLLLTEGYPASIGKDGFLKIWREPIGGAVLPRGTMVLNSFKSVYQGDNPVDYESRILLETSGRMSEVSIRVNDPLVINGFQYSVSRYGFAPAFVVEDEQGEVLLDAFINLVLVGGTEDNFEVPDRASKFFVRFFPDFEMTKDGPVTKSRLPNNPVMAVRVEKFGKSTPYRLLKLGEKAKVAEFQIKFEDLKYWNHFIVTKDAGKPVFVVSFFLVAIGLSIRIFTMDIGRRKGGDGA